MSGRRGVGSKTACAGLALAIGIGAAFCADAPARAAAGPWIGNDHASVRLVTATDRVGARDRLEAGVEFRFGPGWHGYWRTPGDAGVAPQIDWSGSGNVAQATTAWPAPRRLVVEGLQNSVYEGRFILPASLLLKARNEATPLRVTVGYAACSEICVPYQAALALDLRPGSDEPSAEASAIATARSQVPAAPAEAGILVERTEVLGDGSDHRLVIDLRSTGATFNQPDLFVEGDGDGIPAAPKVDLSEDGRRARLTVRLADRADARGPLTATLTDGARAAEFSIPEARLEPAAGLGWLAALGSALLGGLVLNLMPCVLPVLSIKLIGLTRHAGAGRGALRLSLIATALGILACFGLIAAVLVGLTWSGAALGWGIQFQQPWFLAVMATVTILFAANLFDRLPIGLPRALMSLEAAKTRGPLIEAFATGVLATLLATPCSAPFVGTAVGFALSRGPREIVAIFLCLGIGMALPYGVVALSPGLVRWLPRPGAWMARLRQGLGLLLLGTAAWLLTLLWSESGATLAGTVALLLTGLIALRAKVGADRTWSGFATAVLVVAPLAATLVMSPSRAAHTPVDSDWQAFDPAALPGLVAEGRTVLVDVTATWCLTCKVNDLAAFGRPALRERLGQPGTIRMRADWSRPDAAVAAYLHRFGRYGIPFDAVYGPGRPDGEALPELLTPDLVIQALDRAASKAPAAAAQNLTP